MSEGNSKTVIGIPRAMLYHRYSRLWNVFFSELGIRLIISGPTTKGILDEGTDLAIDETCLSTKIFLGHVKELIGKCDYILIPRISNFGQKRYMCTKFEALYDMTSNIFRSTGQKFLAYNIDEKKKLDEETAMTEMGMRLGFPKKQVHKAYKIAKKSEQEFWKRELKKQELLYKSPDIKILLAAHSYIIQDEYIGKPVLEMLDRLGVTVIRADLVERKDAIEQSRKLSPTLKWEVNREIAGGIYMNKDRIDGIIFLSAFPCGPDSMANELLMRKNKDLPALNLVIDAQDGLAGIETRLESFVDIIKFKRGSL